MNESLRRHWAKKSYAECDRLGSKVAILSGGEDRSGRPLVTLDGHEQMVQPLSSTDLVEHLEFLVQTLPPEKTRRGLAVLMDARNCDKSSFRSIAAALEQIQVRSVCRVAVLYILQPKSSKPEMLRQKTVGVIKKKPKPKPSTFQTVVVKDTAKLQRYIGSDQLTFEFGGFLKFNHQEWIRIIQTMDRFEARISDVLDELPKAKDEVSLLLEYDLDPTTDSDSLLRKVRHRYNEVMQRLNLEHAIDESKALARLFEDASRYRGLCDLRTSPVLEVAKDRLKKYEAELIEHREDLKSVWQKAEFRIVGLAKINRLQTKAQKVLRWIQEVGWDLLADSGRGAAETSGDVIHTATNVVWLADKIRRKIRRTVSEYDVGPNEELSLFDRHFEATVDNFRQRAERKRRIMRQQITASSMPALNFIPQATDTTSTDFEDVDSHSVHTSLLKLSTWYSASVAFLPVNHPPCLTETINGYRGQRCEPSSAWVSAVKRFLQDHPAPMPTQLSRLRRSVPVLGSRQDRNEARTLIGRVELLVKLFAGEEPMTLADVDEIYDWQGNADHSAKVYLQSDDLKRTLHFERNLHSGPNRSAEDLGPTSERMRPSGPKFRAIPKNIRDDTRTKLEKTYFVVDHSAVGNSTVADGVLQKPVGWNASRDATSENIETRNPERYISLEYNSPQLHRMPLAEGGHLGGRSRHPDAQSPRNVVGIGCRITRNYRRNCDGSEPTSIRPSGRTKESLPQRNEKISAERCCLSESERSFPSPKICEKQLTHSVGSNEKATDDALVDSGCIRNAFTAEVVKEGGRHDQDGSYPNLPQGFTKESISDVIKEPTVEKVLNVSTTMLEPTESRAMSESDLPNVKDPVTVERQNSVLELNSDCDTAISSRRTPYLKVSSATSEASSLSDKNFTSQESSDEEKNGSINLLSHRQFGEDVKTAQPTLNSRLLTTGRLKVSSKSELRCQEKLRLPSFLSNEGHSTRRRDIEEEFGWSDTHSDVVVQSGGSRRSFETLATTKSHTMPPEIQYKLSPRESSHQNIRVSPTSDVLLLPSACSTLSNANCSDSFASSALSLVFDDVMRQLYDANFEADSTDDSDEEADDNNEEADDNEEAADFADEYVLGSKSDSLQCAPVSGAMPDSLVEKKKARSCSGSDFADDKQRLEIDYTDGAQRDNDPEDLRSVSRGVPLEAGTTTSAAAQLRGSSDEDSGRSSACGDFAHGDIGRFENVDEHVQRLQIAETDGPRD